MMKRRTFIGIAAGAAIDSVIPTFNAGTDSTRLFGVPRSLLSPGEVEENKLRLSMSNTKFPVEVWEEIITCNRFWETIKQQPEATVNVAAYLRLAVQTAVTVCMANYLPQINHSDLSTSTASFHLFTKLSLGMAVE
ncbi:hypothetical protein [Photorhabdus australis]|uniref:hypothetical protein n=2 Tax=Photorhabdus australis TaxID=286156 RepID=UPI001F420B5A|nr:hypothetical protein [Photorhabdus australis]